jgi:hypothetical protein
MINDTVDTTDTLTAVHTTLASQLLHVINKSAHQYTISVSSLILDLAALTLIVPLSSFHVELAPARDEVFSIRPSIVDRVIAIVSAFCTALTARTRPVLTVARVVEPILIANRQAVLIDTTA